MSDAGGKRPRVEGAREREIFTATVELLAEIGYDRLTLDAVAARAKASKATLYRLWGDKSALVDAAIGCERDGELTLPDTGSVVDDLRALIAQPGFFDPERAAIISGLATAIHREPDRLDAVRARLVEDGTKHVRALLRRAVDRHEINDCDVELVCSVIPAVVLFRMTYQTVGTFGAHLVDDIVETLIVPVLHHNSATTRRNTHGSAPRR